MKFILMVHVPHEARGHEIAARASAAPGPGGAPPGFSFEVREVRRAPMPVT